MTELNFDQSLRRQHLLRCFDEKAMVAFPQSKKTTGTMQSSSETSSQANRDTLLLHDARHDRYD